MFAIALALSLATGTLAGLLPALHASRTPPGPGLREDSRSVAFGLGMRRALVVGQVTLALVLITAAGLFVRTLQNLREQGPGFATDNLVMFHVDLGRAGYATPQAEVVMQRLVEAVGELPEVKSTAAATLSLLGPGSWNTRMTVDADRRFVIEDGVHCSGIGPGFFETLGAALVAGRAFDERDAYPPGASGEKDREFRTAIVNEKLANRYFPGKSPIGARLAFGMAPNAVAKMEIVGVVKGFIYRARGLREVEDQAFFPFFEMTGRRGGVLYARTRASSAAAFASIRAAVRRLDPALPITDLRTLDDQLDRALANERLLALLASAFAVLAVLLAVVGLYGVTAFVVARRTREIGIRMALGATRAAALRLVVRDAASMVAVGVLVALPVACGLGRLVSSQLFGVGAMDAATFGGAARRARESCRGAAGGLTD